MDWRGWFGLEEDDPRTEQEILRDERWELLEHLTEAFEVPLTALAFAWLLLLIVDFTTGLNPLLQTITYVIWAVFIVDFVLKMIIAPDKTNYLRHNWLTAIALVLPAARVLRVFQALRVLRAVRAVRTVGLLRVLTSLNRSMRAAAAFLGQRGIGYMVAISVIVLFGGSAGMLLLESPSSLRDAGYADAARQGAGFETYGEAIWWTATVMTTLGPDQWPRTGEGRILGFLLAIYALAVFGYITANIASYFLGRTPEAKSSAGGAKSENAALREEVAALRAEIARLSAALGSERGSPAP